MKPIYILLALLIAASAYGQTNVLHDRTQSVLSPSENNFNQLYRDMDTRQQQQLYANPAFYEVLNRNPSLSTHSGKYRSIVSAGYSAGQQDGDFLSAEGNDFYDCRIMGYGQYSPASSGTLFGNVQYAQGEHRNIGWNTVRYPELYQPYITTDSLGGDFKYEDYQVAGGYSFRIGEFYLGASGKFHGEQAHRKSDPRALNNTTWLSFNAGVARLFNNHLLMFQTGYERNKQHLSLRFWRPGQQDRFLVTYGFGLIDVHQSTISFGYSRMYYINQGNISLTYLSPQEKPFTLYANMGYKHHRMQTEESSIKDLYYSHTNQFELTLRIDYKPTPSLMFSLLAEGTIDKRKGYENIFDQYLVDENNHVYDFRLIDTQQNYKRAHYTGYSQLKATYRINPMHRIEVMGGVSLCSREEKYKSDYKISNQAVYPHAGLAYRLNYKRSEWNLSGIYTYKHLLDNEYDVDILNTNTEYLDFQHAFSPYAYYNSTYSAININATYIHHFSKSALGANLKLMYKNGERNKEAIYTKQIGFPSSAPSISASPDEHNETWFSAGLFYVF